MDRKQLVPHTDNDSGVRRSARRRVLAAIAVGGGTAAGMLPARWSKPLVESVMLPAHAQASAAPQPDPPPPPVVTLPGGFALNGITAVVYIDPWSRTSSLSLAGPAEPGQLAALAIEDPGNGDFAAVSNTQDFTLVNGIDRVQDPADAGRYTVSADLRHEPTGRIFGVSIEVEIDAARTVYVLSAEVSGVQ